MGSGGFAVPIAKALASSREICLLAVVTQPDRPRGRGREVAANPVRTAFATSTTPVLTPERVGDIESELRALSPDLIVVADYGQYIPSRIFDMPPHRSINVHPSLLPKYRGAAPIPWAVANGDAITGVTIQYVSKRMDSGDIVIQRETEIGPDEYAHELETRLADAGAELCLRAIELLMSGRTHATPQEEARATHARKLTKEDGRIDWSASARAIRDRVRALQPWPGAYFASARGRLKILKAAEVLAVSSAPPGTVMEDSVVACGQGALILEEVQPEGKRAMSGAAARNGRYLVPGEVLR